MNLPVPGDPAASGAADDDPEPEGKPVGPDPARTPATRKQLDDIFGDVLPTVTQDERDDRDRAGDDQDRWYRDNRPPHHGG
jgi:hypothetical protein